MREIIIFTAQYLIFIMAAIALLWLIMLPWTQNKKIWLWMLLFLPVSYVIKTIAGKLYYNPRPFVILHFKPIVEHAANNGFPSGHAFWSMALAAIVFPFNKKLGSLLALLALLVARGRVAALVHHPIDVVASIAIVAVVGLVLWNFVYPYARTKIALKKL